VKRTRRETAAAALAAALSVVLFLPLVAGCRSAGPSGGARAPRSYVDETLSVPAIVPDHSGALAHFATAVSLDLEAAKLEQLFNYKRLSTGTRQPSLLRDAEDLRRRALAEIDKALDLEPESALILRRKGEILLELDRVDEAVDLFRQAQAIARADQRWYFRVANRLEMLDRSEAAASILEAAVSEPSPLSPEYHQLALLEMGRLYNAAGRLQAAESAFRRALESMDEAVAAATGPVGRAFAAGVEKDPTGVRRILVAVLIKQGKYEEAVEEARAALDRAADDPRALGALVEALLAAGRRDEAVAAASDFFDANPTSQVAALTLMRLLAGGGQTDEAVAVGKRFLELGEADAKVRTEIISVLKQAGRTKEAERFVLSHPTSEPGYAESLALLDVYVDASEEQKALELGARILEEYPLDVQAAFQVVGRLARGLGDETAERFAREFAAAHESDHRALYALARVFGARGETEKASEAYLELARAGAPYGDVYEGAALHLLEKGAIYDAALLLLDGVENGFLSDPETIRQRFTDKAADPASAAARLEQAAGDYDSALTLLYELVADLYSAAERYEEAESFYRKALEDPVEKLTDYVGLAIALYRQEKVGEAIELVEDLIDSGRGAPPLVRMLVAMLSGDRRYREAARLARKLIAETPTDVDNRLALVGIYVDQGDFDSAEEQLNIARDLAEGDEETLLRVRYYLGIVYDEQGRDSLAVSMWQANLSAAPDDADSNNALAYHWAERGENLEKALELVNKALEQEPESAAYIDTLGWIYYRMGRYEEAVRELRRAAEKMADPEILDHLGDALSAAGDISGALDAWRRALEAGPRFTRRDEIESKIEQHSPGGVGDNAPVEQGEEDGRS